MLARSALVVAVAMASAASTLAFRNAQVALPNDPDLEVIRSLGLEPLVPLSTTDLEPGADRRWAFPRLRASRLAVGEELAFLFPGGRVVRMPLVERTLVADSALALGFSAPDAGASASIVMHRGLVHGFVSAVFDTGHESWLLETDPAAPGGEEYYREPPKGGHCGGAIRAPKGAEDEFDGESEGEFEGGIAGGCTDSGAFVDLLITVTPDFRDAYANLSDEAFSAALLLDVATANTALAASRCAMRYRVVDADPSTDEAEVYLELDQPGGSSIQADLDSITSPTDGRWDSVHALRDETRADLVTIFTTAGGAGGVAWLGAGNPAQGFSANGGLNWSYLVAHELGHNMGSCHAEGDGGGCENGGLFFYSNGWRFFAQGNEYRTVMAYSPGGWIGHFSNPEVSFLGTPTGQHPNPANGIPGADNARTHNETAQIVARYRCALTDASDCDNDGIDDPTAIASGSVPDCNSNDIPDSCDIGFGISADADSDGVPDECSIPEVEFAPSSLVQLDMFGTGVSAASRTDSAEIVLGVGAPGVDVVGGSPPTASNAGVGYAVSALGGVTAISPALRANDPTGNAYLGRSIATYRRAADDSPNYYEREMALVGAFRWPRTDQSGIYPSFGSIYLYERRPGLAWSQVLSQGPVAPWRFSPPSTGAFAAGPYALFGYSVGLGHAPNENSDFMIVGAPGRNDGRGAAYAVRNPSTGTFRDKPGFQRIFSRADGEPGDLFGASVGVETNIVTTGTPRLGVIIGGPGFNEKTGIAMIFERGVSTNGFGTSWAPSAGFDLRSPSTSPQPLLNQGDEFGASVAILGRLAAVGAPGTNESRGRVHFFERNDATSSNGRWFYRGFFTPADAAPGDRFGESVALAPGVDSNPDGTTPPNTYQVVLVGASRKTIAVGSGPSQQRVDAGAAYVLRRSTGASGATLVQRWTMQLPATGDRFGYSVGATRGVGIVGAPFADFEGLNSGAVKLIPLP